MSKPEITNSSTYLNNLRRGKTRKVEMTSRRSVNGNKNESNGGLKKYFYLFLYVLKVLNMNVFIYVTVI